MSRFSDIRKRFAERTGGVTDPLSQGQVDRASSPFEQQPQVPDAPAAGYETVETPEVPAWAPSGAPAEVPQGTVPAWAPSPEQPAPAYSPPQVEQPAAVQQPTLVDEPAQVPEPVASTQQPAGEQEFKSLSGVSAPAVSVFSEPEEDWSDFGPENWTDADQKGSGYRDAVEFIDVHKAFGRNEILRGVNMGLPEGMISMILGPSGTGKSVCIKHMVGLLYPDEGDVLVHGESVPSMALDDLLAVRKKFGVLFQDGALFGSMDVYDNTAFPLRQHTDMSEGDIRKIVDRRLAEVGLDASHDKMPNELSGGMRKRAGFARALVLDPSIVLFDEPDSGLDPVRTALLGELITEMHLETMDEAQRDNHPHLPAFCLITHDIATARKVSQFINVLWKGRIVQSGTTEELFNSENAFVHQFLAGSSRGPLGMN